MQAAKLYYEADLRISADAVGNISATDKSDNPVDVSGCNISTSSFYDKREEASMTVAEVDVAALQACGEAPANGPLYVQHEIGRASCRERV